MDDGLNGRRLHHWRGRPGGKENDTSEFADAIVAAVPELYIRDGVLVQLVEGQLIVVNFASLKSLITKHLCGVRVVQRDGQWEREYFSYEFPPPPRPDPRFGGGRGPQDRSHEPDSTVLDQIYCVELAVRLPRVKSSGGA
jgi:hypothetical protein